MFFGLNEFAVRLSAAVFGVIGIFFMMLAARAAHGRTTALVLGCLLAICPWQIQMSRYGAEYVYWLGTFPIGFYLLLKSRENPAWLPVTAAAFVLSLYTYYPSLFITPLFLLGIGVGLWRSGYLQKYRKQVLLSAAIFLIMCSPLYQG